LRIGTGGTRRVRSAEERNTQEDTAGQASGTNKKERSSLVQRWLTAIVGMPIVVLFAWFGGWWTFAAVLLITLLGIYEFHKMMLHVGYRPVMLISLGLSVLFLVAAMFPQWQLLLLEIGLSASLLVTFPVLFARKEHDGSLVDWALTVAIPIYLGWPLSFFILLRGSQVGWPFVHTPWWVLPRGFWWVLVVLFSVWGSDTGAFFTGRLIGRHKLSPRISPGKTWEGVFGGLVLGTIATILFSAPLGVPWYLAIVLGILTSIAAVLGDLAESLIKRQTHVKDSGQLIPGHGGMLDRVDSILFAVMVVYFFSLLVGK
jgi:phosphatidate cytidylyltransferase